MKNLDLTQGQEKFIALQLHLGNEFFTFENDGTNYICEENKEDLKNEFENDEFENDEFYKWCLENYSCEEIQEIDEEVEYENAEYLVLTDDEADQRWDEDLENYIDDCILYQLPEQYRQYFDRESWKDDARNDGRGNSLNRYNGNEDYEDVNGTTYYIYRTN